MNCAICGKEFGEGQYSTVRETWLKAGGWGDIPDAAIVHPACDQDEMAKIKSGKVKLSDIWNTASK